MPPRRVLIVGGAGMFGSRLVASVLATTALDVVVGGRDRARSAALIARQADPGRLSAVVLDTATVTAAALRSTGAFAVVDAAGPFQGQDHRLAQAAIDAGLHYLDLADARDFVGGIATLDPAALAANVAVLSGASSTPALSNAVLDALTAGWTQLDHVSIAIVPGNRAPRGLSVIRAILSYVGRPVRVFRRGRWTTRPGWGMTRRATIPGLGRRWLSLCEAPDLDIVVQRLRVRRSVQFEAGLELPILHLGLAAAGLLVRAGLLRSLASWAGPARWAAGLLERFGTDRGAMQVDARGLDAAGQCVRATWTLIAEAGDGPSIPTMPALALLRALSEDRLEWRGAGPCVGTVPLAAIEHELAALRVSQTRRTEHVVAVFPAVLGAGFLALPPPIQRLHQPGWFLGLHGTASVEGASGPLAALVGRLFGFPAAAAAVPVRVTMEAEPGGERWTRVFGTRRFVSRLRPAGAPGLLQESFGPFRFDIRMQAIEGTLHYTTCGWRLAGVPLPRALMPASVASESVDDAGRFVFDVEIALPLRLGRIVRYRGWLEPD